ncbi:MAG TPA: acetyl-CoA carboxylase biotin carboxyl carrier protein [Azospirillum sp.]|nr:acetyl-CoA carboxylase biotin carboxyl carrier protein [Azospirillum sp.]
MATFDIDGDLIRKIADLLRETGLNEIEFAEGDKRLRITRSAPAAAHVVHAAVPAAAPVPTGSASVAAAPTTGAAHPGAVTSPMVGTAYASPEPGAAPFVKVGDTVKAGQTILIIEAMKVMNPIKAPRGGTVSEILVADAQPVEFGEVLMVIE